MRSIDWSATARAGHTFVKKYREERQLTVIFVVDLSASGGLGAGEVTKREQAVEMASVLALAAVHSDHRVGLVTFTDSVESFVPPARGRRHAFRLVNDLVAFQPQGRGTDLSLALRFVREHLNRRAVVVILSDFLLGKSGLEQARPELRALTQRHDVVAIRVGDRLDRQLPAVGLLTIEDAGNGPSRRSRHRQRQATSPDRSDWTRGGRAHSRFRAPHCARRSGYWRSIR